MIASAQILGRGYVLWDLLFIIKIVIVHREKNLTGLIRLRRTSRIDMIFIRRKSGGLIQLINIYTTSPHAMR